MFNASRSSKMCWLSQQCFLETGLPTETSGAKITKGNQQPINVGVVGDILKSTSLWEKSKPEEAKVCTARRMQDGVTTLLKI